MRGAIVTIRRCRDDARNARGVRKLYANSQWAVTPCGMESLEPGRPCHIKKERLGEAYHGFPNVLLQVGLKRWVNRFLISVAFEHALRIHGIAHEFSLIHSYLDFRDLSTELPTRRRKPPL
jgi:hypothetical protein